jgi:hypothetical protein
VEIEHTFAVVTFDRKHFLKNRLQPDVLSAAWSGLQLQELHIGIGLQFDQIGWGDDLFNLTEVDSFCCSRWHFFIPKSVGKPPDLCLTLTTQGKCSGCAGKLAVYPS